MVAELYSWFTEIIHSIAHDLSGGEPTAKGLVVVGLLGVVLASMRNLPVKVFELIKRKCSVSVRVEDSWKGETRRMHRSLGAFIAENQVSKRFLCFSDDEVEGQFKKSDVSIVPDYSDGFFFYKGRPYFYTNNKASEQGAVPANIMLTTIGKSVDVIWNAVNLEARVNANNKTRNFYAPKKNEWEEIEAMGPSPKIFLDPETKKKLDDKIDFFKNNESWYRERGISYKLLIILYGVPGTGKSSISRYVADRLGYSLGTLDSSIYFEESMRSATKRQMVVSVPDFDTMGFAKSRGDLEKDDEDTADLVDPNGILKPTSGKPKMTEISGALSLMTDLGSATLGRVLNLFQGDIPINNLVAVMSTNCIDNIDTALLRRGRCDLLLEIGLMKYSEINKFYQHHYKLDIDLPMEFFGCRIKACDVSGIFEDNAFSHEGFVDDLRQFIK